MIALADAPPAATDDAPAVVPTIRSPEPPRVVADYPGCLWAETIIRARSGAQPPHGRLRPRGGKEIAREIAVDLRVLREAGKPDLVSFDFEPQVDGERRSENLLTPAQFAVAFALLQQAVAYGRDIGVLPRAGGGR